MKVKSAKQGRHQDGDGLMLYVQASGAKSWVVRLQGQGRRRDYGLGSLKDVTLAEARERATEYRKLVRAGADPIELKQRRLAESVQFPTFELAARKAFEEQKKGWRNKKHRAQWLKSLETFVFPKFGATRIDMVNASIVREALLPIWLEKPETARRVKQRICAVLDWAYSNDFRDSEAPVRAINKGLPKQPRRDRHFAAMPYEHLPELMKGLAAGKGVGSLALRFLILSAARSGEVRGARWSEIDFKKKVWTVPAERMKARREHNVPLPAYSLEILKTAKMLPRIGDADLIFPGLLGKPLSDMTLAKALSSAGVRNATVHGMRSSFRDWAAEKTSFSGDVAEAALAHTIKNQVEAAYRRTNFLDKRRTLMHAWGVFLHESGLGD